MFQIIYALRMLAIGVTHIFAIMLVMIVTTKLMNTNFGAWFDLGICMMTVVTVVSIWRSFGYFVAQTDKYRTTSGIPY